MEETEEPVLMVSVPCTPWAKFQPLNLKRGNEETKKKIMIGRLQTNRFLKNLKVIAEKVKERNGQIIYEWPTGMEGWNLKAVQELKKENNLEEIKVHGCTLGVCAEGDVTKPIKKPWTIVTSLEELKISLRNRRCTCIHDQVHCAGKYAKVTGHYPIRHAKSFG